MKWMATASILVFCISVIWYGVIWVIANCPEYLFITLAVGWLILVVGVAILIWFITNEIDLSSRRQRRKEKRG